MMWTNGWQKKVKTLRKSTNQPNCGVLKGHRFMVHGTVNQIKKIVGKHAKKVQISGKPGIVEIIHTDNHGVVFTLLREAKVKFA